MLGNITECKNARTCDGPPMSKTCLSNTDTKFNSGLRWIQFLKEETKGCKQVAYESAGDVTDLNGNI